MDEVDAAASGRSADIVNHLFIGGPLPGMNELIESAKAGGRGMGYAKLKKVWTENVWALAKVAQLKPIVGRAKLHFHWIERDKRRDPDNIAAGGRKLILDGLVMAGVLEGDGWRFVDTWSDSFTTAPGQYGPGCLVRVESVDD